MAAAAQRVSRDPTGITLMAVSKTFPAEKIIEAFAAGQRVFGENRVQEFESKAPELRGLRDAGFHLIGHLQSNKAHKAATLFHAVDSVDSLKLAERLNAAAVARKLPVLIEINVGGEDQKAGLYPESVELEELFQASTGLTNLEIRGLMCIPPHTDDPKGARPFFRKLRELRDRLCDRHRVELPELSMGMSHDFEIAIEEGSTCVRVGTAIFGQRIKKP